ncbi:MAG: hypothetical protein ACK5LL_04100 [Suipraeoptans sp.]
MNDNFMIALEMMWKGMLGIFVVIGIITLIVLLLTKLDAYDKKKEDDKSRLD